MYRDDLATIEHLREENLRLQMMIASLETSRSWRTTAPLRRYAAFLRAHHILPEITQKLSRGLLSTYEWQHDTDLNHSPAPRIAVLAHIYYPELSDEIAVAAKACGPLASVIVTYVNPEALPQIKSSFTDHHITNVEYVLVENLGRDMWPMLQVLRSELLDDVDAILKIHTKKSLHLEKGKGDAWRKSLINGLVPSQAAVTNLAAEFARNPRLAWACPWEWVAGNESWGRNKKTVTRLLSECGLKRPKSLVFPAGSMFWMGRELRACLLDLELTRDNFSATPSLDGSFEHGLERFIGSWSLATQGIMYRTQYQSPNRKHPEYAMHLANDQTDEQL